MKEPRFYRTYDYDKALLPNSFLRKLEKGVRDIDAANKKTGKTIGYPGWCMIYYLLLCHLRPDRNNILVETGTNWGCSTIIMAQALSDSGCQGLIHTFEIDENAYEAAVSNLKKSRLGRFVNPVLGDSRTGLKKYLGDSETVRFAFLDGSHLQDDVMEEFSLVYPHLEPDALVVFDNTYAIAEQHEDQRVNGALKKIRNEYGGNLINLEFVSWYTPGLAIWQKAPAL